MQKREKRKKIKGRKKKENGKNNRSPNERLRELLGEIFFGQRAAAISEFEN